MYRRRTKHSYTFRTLNFLSESWNPFEYAQNSTCYSHVLTYEGNIMRFRLYYALDA